MVECADCGKMFEDFTDLPDGICRECLKNCYDLSEGGEDD